MPREQLLQQKAQGARLHALVHRGVRVLAAVVEGGAEVAQLRLPAVRDQDVMRVAVAVCQAAAVQVCEARDERARDAAYEAPPEGRPRRVGVARDRRERGRLAERAEARRPLEDGAEPRACEVA